MRALTWRESAPADDDAGDDARGRAAKPEVRRRRPRLVRWLALALVLAVLGAAGGYSYLQVRRLENTIVGDFHLAQNHLERGKALLKQANQKHDVKAIQQARSEFQAGIDEFRQARAAADQNRLAGAAGRVPFAGGLVTSRLDAVDNLADMGVALSRAAIRGGDVDQLFLTPAQGAGPTGTARLLALVQSVKPALSEIRTYLDEASRAAGRVDPALLPRAQQATFSTVKGTIAKGLAGLDEFDRITPVMNEILGVNGPRIYLVEQVNPFELRAGGGYIGTYSLVTADNGQLKVEGSGDTHGLADFGNQVGDAGYVSPPPTLTEFLGKSGWNLGDSNFFPDFPSNATAALSFGGQDFNGKHIDGVIALDLYAVQTLLKLTGPVQAQGTTTKLDANNLFQTMILLDIEDPTRKAVLGALAGPLMSRVTGLGSERWPQLLDVLNQLATQRHLEAYLSNQQAETEVTRLGWSGGLAWGGSKDFAFPVESNFGGNKSNYYLTRQYTVDLTRSGSILHHRVQLDLSLDLSKAPLPATAKWAYRGYFRLFVPADATNTSVSNVKADDHPYTNVPSGSKVIDGWQQLNPGANRKGTMEIVFQYDTPWAGGAGDQESLYWQKQPGTEADKIVVHWNDGTTTAAATSTLSTDLVLTLAPKSVKLAPGQVAQAQLPKVSF